MNMKMKIPNTIAYIVIAFCALMVSLTIVSIEEESLLTVLSNTRHQMAQVTTGAVYETVKYEAESGALTDPMVTSTDSNASGGTYVSSKTVDSGSVTIPITVSKTGTYVVWGRVLAPTYSNDSFNVSVDGGAKDVWDTAEGLWSPKWQWTRVTGRASNNNSPVQLNAIGRTFQLSAGVHNITFQGRDASSQLDTIVVTNDTSFVPTDALPVPEIKKITLSVSTAGTGAGTISGGVINCGSVCSQTTTVGNTLAVSAVAASGSTFGGWSGACSGTAQCSVVMDADTSVVATFTAVPVPVAPTPTETQTTPVVTTDTTNTTPATPATQPVATNPVTNPVEAVVTTNTAVAAPVADTNPPSAPANLRALSIAKTSVSLAWDVPADNVGVTSYVVYRNNTKVATVNSNAWLDSTRKPGNTYTYKVTASDAAGNISPASASITVTTIPSSSLLFKVGDQVIVTSSTNVRSAAGSSRKLVGTQKPGAIGRISNGPVWSNGYWWWNINFDTGVDGWAIENYLAKYTPASGTVDTTAPSVPTGLRADGVSTSEINVLWNTATDNVGVTGYKLYRDGVLLSTQAANTYADSGLQASTGYAYTVNAYDAAGNSSALSTSVTGTTLAKPVTQTYTLTVSKTGTGSGSVSGGSISCGAMCTQTANSGTSITLSAVAATDSTFIGWSGACTGTGTCTVTLNSDKSVAAQFDLAQVVVPTYTVSVAKGGTGSGTVTGGSINCGSTCSQTVNSGTTLTFSATPNAGSTFSGWSGACSGSSPTCNVTLSTNAAVSASFTQNVVVTPPPTPTGTAWYAAPNGSSSGTGSITSAWDLKTALAGGNGKIQAGHTLYLRGGTYTGLFTSTLTGTNASPIVVRSAPGEWAIVDGAPFASDTQVSLQVNGAHTWYRDFEVMNSNANRPTSFPFRPAAVNVYGANTKFINMIVHDGGQGIGLWSPATDSEIYGSIIYNNGGEYRDHGIYTQNDSSAKLISDNIIANNYGYGIHAYGSGSALLANYTINNNTLVNNPSLIGNRSVRNMSFRNNSLYNASFNFGYNNPYNQTGYIENNYFVATQIDYMGWKDLHVRNNTFWRNGEKAGALTGVTFYDGFAYSDIEFSNNTYLQSDPWESTDWGVWTPAGAKGYKFSATSFGPPAEGIWQSLGYDADSTGSKYVRSTTGNPTGKVTFVRPNKYEDGRALVSVYNWDLADKVDVSLNNVCYSSGVCLKAGDTFVVKNGLNPSESITLTADANNVISIPMKTWTMAAPIGTAPAITARPTTFPEFGAFVIIKK